MLALVGNPAAAEVVDASASGFSVRTTVEIAAAPDVVYDALTTGVSKWWDASHSWSGQAANLSLDPRPGGCLCEKLPGGGVQHMTVLFADRGRMLRLSGGLGPLQAMPGNALWTFTFTDVSGRTRLEATYSAFVHTKDDLVKLAPLVDQVTGGQITRLKAFIERGRAD